MPPHWPDRDRFVLSGGHASMVLCGALHLCGYDLSLDDIRSFRQLGSRCAGHPERGLAPGVERAAGVALRPVHYSPGDLPLVEHPPPFPAANRFHVRAKGSVSVACAARCQLVRRRRRKGSCSAGGW
ncbi:MAG: hypothetical protein ACRDR6_25985 [Pseudonocardiaceae bacterium]